MEWLATACSVLAGIATICSILTFVNNRKRANQTDGGNMTQLQSDLRYVRDGIDDIRLDIKDLTRKQNDMSIKIAREDERIASIERRVKKLEDNIVKGG